MVEAVGNRSKAVDDDVSGYISELVAEKRPALMLGRRRRCNDFEISRSSFDGWLMMM